MLLVRQHHRGTDRPKAMVQLASKLIEHVKSRCIDVVTGFAARNWPV